MAGGRVRSVASRRILPVLAAAALGLPGTPALAQEPGETVVALLVSRDDRIAGDTIFEVLPLARYADGAYRTVVGWEIPGDADVLRGDSLLAVHRRYAVFRKGRQVGSMVVDSVVRDDFECSELPVGKGTATVEAGAFGAVQPTVPMIRGRMGGREVRYGLTVLLALDERAPAVDTQGRSIPDPAALRPDQRSLLVEEATRRVAEQAGQEGGPGVDVRSLTSYDFDGDGTYEHLVVVGATDREGRSHSVVLAGRFRDGRWMPLLAESRSEAPDSWGDGYRLLDVMDLDGDSVPEIVFEVRGYEATSYGIYGFTGEGFEQAFSEVLFGC